ncbi:MAG: PKD domain-containing protein [Solirubrobacteraceae bacterium]|nr:PKD domain-containing protein [Solirubrobacteraceae bacterium]
MCTVALLSLSSTTATAAVAPSWQQIGTHAMVQAQEGEQLPHPPVTASTAQVLAHGYAVQTTGTAQGPVLKLRTSQASNIPKLVHAITLLDFDRNGSPEVAVDTEVPLNTQTFNYTATARVYDIASVSGTDKCLTVPSSGAVATVTTQVYESITGVTVSDIPLSALQTGATKLNPGALLNPPRMLSLITSDYGVAGSPRIFTFDRLPEASKPATDAAACAENALSYDFSKATDRYAAGSAPSAKVVHTDPAGDNPGGLADLTRVAVEQRTVRTPGDDLVTDDGATVARTVYPSDLVVDFASASLTSSVTVVWTATWNRNDQFQPLERVAIRTEPAGNGKVKVTVSPYPVGVGSHGGDVIARCLTKGDPAAMNDRVYTATLERTAQGTFRVSVPLDEFLDSEGGYGSSGNDGKSTLRFATMSDPGQLGSFAPIDQAPFFAGYRYDGTNPAGGCEPRTGVAGVQVYPERSFLVGATPPVVQLNANTTNPARGETVTFDLGQSSTGYGPSARLCSLAQVYTPTTCQPADLTQTYQQKTTARLAVNADGGAWDEVDLDIKIRNNRPSAAISRVGTNPAQGTDGTYAIVQGAPVAIPLEVTATDSDPSTFTYRWTLDDATSPVSTAKTYTPSFSAPGTYVVRAYAIDDSEDPATEESPAAVLTMKVVRSPQGSVEIVRPARVVTGVPFDIEAQTAPNTGGYSTLSWQWDLDGDADVDFDPARTTRQLTDVVFPTANPSQLVRVRATDAGGRVADATIQLNVRRTDELVPLAKLSVTPASPTSGTAITFDGSASELSDGTGQLQGPVGQTPSGVRFHWSFGDGTPDVVTTTATTTHTYAGSGRPKATLLVEDVRSTPTYFSEPAERSVDVAPGATDANAPVAKLVRQDPPPADPVFAKRPVTITAATSTAAAGHAPLTYAFDLDGDGTFEKANAAEPTITFTPPFAGPLTVAVKATDVFSSTATATVALDVQAEPIAPPTATLAGPAELALSGASVSGEYDATGSKGNNLDPAVTYRWDLDDDGTFETPTGSDPKIKATFEYPGRRSVHVRVTDRYGNTADASKPTIVRTAADIAAGCVGNSALRTVDYENVQLRGCVTTVERPSAGDLSVVVGKALILNGMRLTPAAGERPTPRPFSDCNDEECKRLESDFNSPTAPWAVVLDSSDGSLRSNAPTSMKASGSNINLPLFSGALNVSLPDLAEEGFTLATPAGADLVGFPLTGGVTLKFPDPGEVTITVTVGLPRVAGGFTGEATVRVDATNGLVLDDLSIDVGELALGKLTFGELSFVYSRLEALWKGGATLTLPTPKAITVSASLAIQNNQFKSISAGVSGLNQPIAQGIFLQALRAGISVDPLDLTAGVGLSAGPAVKGKTVLGVDGDMRLKFPDAKANYYLFSLTGKLKVADFQLASGFAQFTSNGFFELGGGINATFPIGYARAQVKGWLTANAFNVDADATVGVTLGGWDYDLFGGHMTVSTTGFGACGEIPIIGLGGGFGARWAGGAEAFWGCDLAPYRAARPADAPATLAIRAGVKAPRTDVLRGRLLLAGPEGHLLDVPAKREKALITVTGATAPPRVSIVDTEGKVLLSTPADGSDALTKEMLVKGDPAQKTTTILWKAPPTGKVWVVEQAQSSAATKVDMALPAPDRKLNVSVGGSGRARTLNWNITPALQPGETVSLAEVGAQAGTQIINTAKSTGSVPFTPQGGQAGKRTIEATISADGLPSTKVASATYTAPAPPVPSRPASVVLRRSASGVLAKWTPGTGGGAKTEKWRVLVRVAHTQRKKLLVLDAKQRTVRIPEVNPGDAVAVSVTGASAGAIEGPAREAIVKAGLRASTGPLSLAATAKPTDVVVKRIAGGKLRVTWKSGGAFVRGWSVRVSGAANGRRKGSVTLLRTAGKDHSVDFANAPEGELRVSVIGRRFQGSSTRKDVVYLGGRTN